MMEQLKMFSIFIKDSVYGLSNYKSQTDAKNIIGVLTIMFAIALLGEAMPYDYYITLRTIVCLCLGYTLYKNKERLAGGYYCILFTGMLLYNPVYPIHLESQVLWFPVNLVTLFVMYKIHVELSVSEEE